MVVMSFHKIYGLKLGMATRMQEYAVHADIRECAYSDENLIHYIHIYLPKLPFLGQTLIED